MPTLKRCYCFCLPIWGKFSPWVLGSQGRQEIWETHWRWRPHCQPNPAGLFQRPRQEAEALHSRTGPNLPCLVPFCPHRLWSKDEFVPRGRVCLSLWEQCPWSSVLWLHKVIDWFQPWPPSISSPFTRQCWQWHVFWRHRYTQVRLKRAVNEASFIDPVQCWLLMHSILVIHGCGAQTYLKSRFPGLRKPASVKLRGAGICNLTYPWCSWYRWSMRILYETWSQNDCKLKKKTSFFLILCILSPWNVLFTSKIKTIWYWFFSWEYHGNIYTTTHKI